MNKVTALFDVLSKNFSKQPKIEKFNRILYSTFRLFFLLLLITIVIGFIVKTIISIISNAGNSSAISNYSLAEIRDTVFRML